MSTESHQSGQTPAEFRAWLFSQLREMGRVAEPEEALRDYSARLDVLRTRNR